jgi:hypothetical protein
MRFEDLPLPLQLFSTAISPFEFAIAPRPSEANTGDPVVALRAMMDDNAGIKARRRAAETAIFRILEARRLGASLYLADMDADDFAPILGHAAEMTDRWLEGFREPTADFRRRVRLAEAAFLALCEALLRYDPVRGTQLWRVLRATVATRYIGAAGVEELLHIVFRVPDSPAVTVLREDLVGLDRCHTDQALFDLAVAASCNGKTAWLAAVIEADRASALVWRRKRGATLAGFTVNNTLPVAGAWPDGQIRTEYAELNRRSARFRWIEACARYWWRVYLAAHDAAEAYAAWILFLHSADQRASVWMREDVQAANGTGAFFRLKLSHAGFNRSRVERTMEKRADKFDKNFLDRQIVVGLGPWGKEGSSA